MSNDIEFDAHYDDRNGDRVTDIEMTLDGGDALARTDVRQRIIDLAIRVVNEHNGGPTEIDPQDEYTISFSETTRRKYHRMHREADIRTAIRNNLGQLYERVGGDISCDGEFHLITPANYAIVIGTENDDWNLRVITQMHNDEAHGIDYDGDDFEPRDRIPDPRD